MRWGSYFYFDFPWDEDEGEEGGEETEDDEPQGPYWTQLVPFDFL